MKVFFAVFLAKCIALLTRILRIGGGSAAPGLWGLRIEPNLITHLSCCFEQKIIICGTNGKTTTSRMIAHIARMNDITVMRNSTGSNLERGLVSTLISHISWYDLLTLHITPPHKIAIFEVDEAAFNVIVPKLKPSTIVFLNLYRDQLDRYGEVDTILKRWLQTLKKLDYQPAIILNQDDRTLQQLIDKFPSQTFAVRDHALQGEQTVQKTKKHHDPTAEAFEITNLSLGETTFSVSFQTHTQQVALPIPGIYHVYDFLAAFLVGELLQIAPAKSIDAIKTFSPAFGRVERILLPVKSSLEKSLYGYIFLIKNPTGATVVLETIAQFLTPKDVFFLALNDYLADGTDVSWIWDTEFERISTLKPAKIVISGSRCYDLALRLKYAGFDPESLVIEPNIKTAFGIASKELQGDLFMLPTYTALLELQKILTKMGLKKHYWEEE
jgi:UDP-N-acetylmuramyl tripeptide synthase